MLQMPVRTVWSLIISEVLVNFVGVAERWLSPSLDAAGACMLRMVSRTTNVTSKERQPHPLRHHRGDDLPCKPLHGAKILYEKRNPTYILGKLAGPITTFQILHATVLQPNLFVSHPSEESINIYSPAKIVIQSPVWDFISNSPYVLRVPDFSSITSATMARQVSSTSEMIDYFIAFFLPPVSPPLQPHGSS